MRVWEVEVEVRCLRRPVHSGRGGGVVPDPIQLLCRLIARLRGGHLTVVRFEAPRVLGSINQITDVARARLRLAPRPGVSGREQARRVARRLKARPPCGAPVRVRLACVRGPD